MVNLIELIEKEGKLLRADTETLVQARAVREPRSLFYVIPLDDGKLWRDTIIRRALEREVEYNAIFANAYMFGISEIAEIFFEPNSLWAKITGNRKQYWRWRTPVQFYKLKG